MGSPWPNKTRQIFPAKNLRAARAWGDIQGSCQNIRQSELVWGNPEPRRQSQGATGNILPEPLQPASALRQETALARAHSISVGRPVHRGSEPHRVASPPHTTSSYQCYCCYCCCYCRTHLTRTPSWIRHRQTDRLPIRIFTTTTMPPASSTKAHSRSHALLLLQKLFNLRDSASPLTLVLDTLEQTGRPVIREFIARAKVGS
jgi:hypothetical protein